MPQAETLLDRMKAMAAAENARARRTWGTTSWANSAGESQPRREARLAREREARERRQDLCLTLYEAGRTTAEIAQLLGMPRGTVKGYVFDARQRRNACSSS